MQSQNMEYREGMNYGMGINILNGQIPGKGVIPNNITGPTDAGGGKARYFFKIINTFEDLYDSIGISIEAGGHYGLFSAEGKFEFSNETKFNSQSTFLLARAVVKNAFTQCEDAKLEDPAVELIKQGKKDVFRERYGDGFVRGMQTGGEYFAVIEITNISTTKQEDLALSIMGEYQALVAGAKIEVDIKKTIEEKRSQSKTNVTQYQTGGKGSQGIGPTISPEQVVDRLKNFADIVMGHPVPFSVQVAGYTTLDNYPEEPTPFDYQNQKDVLEDCARKRLILLQARNDIEFVQLHPDYYENPPEMTVLNKWSTDITTTLNELTVHARHCASKVMECKFFEFKLPGDYVIPKRKENMPEGPSTPPEPQVEKVPVPNMIGIGRFQAFAKIRNAGLRPAFRSLGKNPQADAEATNVIKMEPAPGTEVPKGTIVGIFFYERSSTRPVRSLGKRKRG